MAFGAALRNRADSHELGCGGSSRRHFALTAVARDRLLTASQRYPVLHPVDLMIRAGRFRAPLPAGLPYVPGWDVAGTVDAVGPSAGDLNYG
ncbi:alcohol dehydrogenase catalytic domain-containing protein [Streptomyces sp. NPDC058470]|uniref:alcohol dehydrogenase catalytic domain-containing protein n=1 Tax=Streptomyces sp. NPDC058470 TaxID=3346515 RepID=UPI0036607E52